MSKQPHSPASYLAEGLYLYMAVNTPSYPIWRRRVFEYQANFGRTVIVELSRDLVLRVRDPKTGQVLTESQPGKLANLAP